MQYELCQKLKDAGYPQNNNSGWFKDDGEIEYIDDYSEYGYGQEFLCYEPDLSELIEACKNRFVGLDRQNGDKEWKAVGIANQGMLIQHQASTPEEAVAMLYLALHGKDTHTKPN